ncbi:MAG: HIT family protein [Bacilli bacterium]|jgi:histidine triad protein|nr:HIT family protein [Bacilli bacterium]
MDCVFCKIVDGTIPSMKLYEDDLVMAFLDVNPDSDGHTLIIPKNHYKDIYDLPDEILTHVYKIARKIGGELTLKLGCDGISYLQNNGAVQEVKHYHLHVKPFYNNKDSLKVIKNKSLINDPQTIYEKLK